MNTIIRLLLIGFFIWCAMFAMLSVIWFIIEIRDIQRENMQEIDGNEK